MGRRLFQLFIGWPVVMHDRHFLPLIFLSFALLLFFARTQIDYRIYHAETENRLIPVDGMFQIYFSPEYRRGCFEYFQPLAVSAIECRP